MWAARRLSTDSKGWKGEWVPAGRSGTNSSGSVAAPDRRDTVRVSGSASTQRVATSAYNASMIEIESGDEEGADTEGRSEARTDLRGPRPTGGG